MRWHALAGDRQTPDHRNFVPNPLVYYLAQADTLIDAPRKGSLKPYVCARVCVCMRMYLYSTCSCCFRLCFRYHVRKNPFLVLQGVRSCPGKYRKPSTAWFPALRIRSSVSVTVSKIRVRTAVPEALLPFPYRDANGYEKIELDPI